MTKKEETEKTDFANYDQQNEYDVKLKDLELVEIKTLEEQVITMEGAFTAESDKWKGSRYAILLLPNKKFTLGGSVIAEQIEKFKADGKTYPATAKVCKRTSKKTSKDYYVLG